MKECAQITLLKSHAGQWALYQASLGTRNQKEELACANVLFLHSTVQNKEEKGQELHQMGLCWEGDAICPSVTDYTRRLTGDSLGSL